MRLPYLDKAPPKRAQLPFRNIKDHNKWKHCDQKFIEMGLRKIVTSYQIKLFWQQKYLNAFDTSNSNLKVPTFTIELFFKLYHTDL